VEETGMSEGETWQDTPPVPSSKLEECPRLLRLAFDEPDERCSFEEFLLSTQILGMNEPRTSFYVDPRRKRRWFAVIVCSTQNPPFRNKNCNIKLQNKTETAEVNTTLLLTSTT